MLSQLFQFSSYIFNPYSIPTFVTAFLLLLLGVFLVFQARNKQNFTFAITLFSIFLWLFSTGVLYSVKSDELALFIYKYFAFLGLVFISPSVYWFVVIFIGKEKKWLVWTNYIIGASFYVILISTNLLPIGINNFYWGWNVKFPLSMTSFILFFFTIMLSILINLGIALKKETEPVKKKQIKMMTIGLFIAYLASSDFITAFGVETYPFGYIPLAIFCFIIAYSIYRFSVFGVRLEQLRIRNKILIPILLTTLILAIMTGSVVYYFSSNYIKDEIYKSLEVSAIELGSQVDDYMKSRQDDVVSLSYSPLIKSFFKEETYDGVHQITSNIKKRAISVSEEISEYLKKNPQATIKDLQKDPEFQAIAVQPVGKTGYTAVTDYDSLIARFHKSPSIVDLDLHVLADKLPDFWSIMSKTEGGKRSEGFYDWLEPDGSIEKKYMDIEIVDKRTSDGVGLSVAATTYINEYDYDLDTFKQVSTYLKNYNETHNYFDLLLLNASGDILFSSENKVNANQNVNDDSFRGGNLQLAFSNILTGKSFTFSGKKITPEKIINKSPYIASAIYDNSSGELIGILALEVDLSKINDLLKKSLSHENKNTKKTYLIDNNFFVRTSSEYDKDLEEFEIIKTENSKNCFAHSYLTPEQIQKNHQEINTFLNSRKKLTLGSHYYIPKYNWCLLVEVLNEDATSSVTRLFKIFAFIGLGYFLIFYLVINYISRVISRPINKLQEDIKLIEAGNLDHKVGTETNDEMGALSRAFDRMTATIKKSRGDIDKKVKEQTEEIIEKQKLLRDEQKAVLNVLEDVEEEKNNVGKEKDKIDAILHSIGDGVFAINNRMEITMFNEIAENISGYKADEVIDKDYKKLLKFVNEKDGKINDSYIAKVIKTGEPQKMPRNINLIKKNGEQVPVADIASPLQDKDGNVRGAVIVFRDVEKERAIDKTKTEFVSLASHQLRTPLTSINWYTEMILAGDAGKVTPDQKSYLDEIYKGNQRMVTLVNSLLNVSRLELGTFTVEPKIISIKDLAEQEIKALLPQTKKKNINITKSYDQGIDKYKADPKLLAMIFQNLLSNAVKYNNEGGKVNLKIQKRAHDIYITVADNGYGIPKKQHKNIFTKLFRADNVRQMDTEGTGLGVYIIKEIVDQAGGNIKFDSEEGKGTTFYVSLPLDGMKKKKGTKTLEE